MHHSVSFVAPPPPLLDVVASQPGRAKTRRAPFRVRSNGPPLGLASVGDDIVKHASFCTLCNQVNDSFYTIAFFFRGNHGRLARLCCAMWENLNSAQWK